MEMDTSSWNAGTSKDLRTAFEVCVMLTLNAVTFKLNLDLAGISLPYFIIQIVERHIK